MLITTVGPFERFGHTTARAATDAGAHHVDATGEVGFVRALRERHHDRARAAGAVMLPAFGYDYVPGALAGALAARQAGPDVRALDIGYFVDGSLRGGRGLSQGTRKTVADGITPPVTVRRNDRLVDERVGHRVQAFRVDGRTRRAALASGSEVLFLPARIPALESVAVYNGWFPGDAVRLASRVANAAVKHLAGERLVDAVRRRAVGPAGGPDATERVRTRTRVVAVARDASGAPLAEVQLEGPGIYDLTGELMAWAGEQLAAGHGRTPGVVGPIDAFGLDTLAEGCAGIGPTQV
ncbi:saccharopine dehydrogenase [Streptomyces sp. NPDC002463]|uniref:saccharopine dehydrogenase n=1 Tax=Streptomyces sp. NPDC002463 TaxID=3364645 RepID=UPI00368E9614